MFNQMILNQNKTFIVSQNENGDIYYSRLHSLNVSANMTWQDAVNIHVSGDLVKIQKLEHKLPPDLSEDDILEVLEGVL